MSFDIHRRLSEDLQDNETRFSYGEELAKLDFAVVLGKARRSMGITQDQLAHLLGVKQPYIARLESGEANPTIGQVGKTLAAIWHRLSIGTSSLIPEVSMVESATNRPANPNARGHTARYFIDTLVFLNNYPLGEEHPTRTGRINWDSYGQTGTAVESADAGSFALIG